MEKGFDVNDLKPDMTDTQKQFVFLTSINATVNDHSVDLAKLRRIVFEGNGEPPLVQKVADMKAYLDGVKFWTRAVALALLAQTIAFATATAIAVIQLLPLLHRIAAQGQ